jgi:acetoacetate decarboxylase
MKVRFLILERQMRRRSSKNISLDVVPDNSPLDTWEFITIARNSGIGIGIRPKLVLIVNYDIGKGDYYLMVYVSTY